MIGLIQALGTPLFFYWVQEIREKSAITYDVRTHL